MSKVLKLLKKHEWEYTDHCPVCVNTSQEGHSGECFLGQAIAIAILEAKVEPGELVKEIRADILRWKAVSNMSNHILNEEVLKLCDEIEWLEAENKQLKEKHT